MYTHVKSVNCLPYFYIKYLFFTMHKHFRMPNCYLVKISDWKMLCLWLKRRHQKRSWENVSFTLSSLHVVTKMLSVRRISLSSALMRGVGARMIYSPSLLQLALINVFPGRRRMLTVPLASVEMSTGKFHSA